MLWEPKTLCICASLRSGTLVLGWLGVIGSMIHLYCLIGFYDTHRVGVYRICVRENRYNLYPTTCDIIIKGVFAFDIITECITLTTCILLLVGVDKNSPSLMLPYLIETGIYIAIWIMMGLAAFILLAYKELIWGAFYFFILFFGTTFLSVYFFLVVRTYYKKMKQRGDPMESNPRFTDVEKVN